MLHHIQLKVIQLFLIQSLIMTYTPKNQLFSDVSYRWTNYIFGTPIGCWQFLALLSETVRTVPATQIINLIKVIQSKNNFGTFRHFGFPRGEIFLDRSKDRWPLMIFIKVHFAATGFPSWWKWPLIWSLINQRWTKMKKTKKTQKNPTKWIFLEKRQQKKILKFLRWSHMQSFRQILRVNFEIG